MGIFCDFSKHFDFTVENDYWLIQFYFADDSKPAAIQTTNQKSSSSQPPNLFPSKLLLLNTLISVVLLRHFQLPPNNRWQHWKTRRFVLPLHYGNDKLNYWTTKLLEKQKYMFLFSATKWLKISKPLAYFDLQVQIYFKWGFKFPWCSSFSSFH